MFIGETYSWQPTAFMENGWRDGNKTHKKDAVHGRIVYINTAHRYFTAETVVNGYRLRESFKF